MSKMIFSELFQDCTSQGRKIPKEHYLKEGLFPIIDQGQSQIAGYVNSKDGLYTDVPAIIFGDHTRVFKYFEIPFFLGADGVKLLKCKNLDTDIKYLFYALCAAKIPDTGYNRHFKWLKELSFSIPDIKIQRHIVCILDRINVLLEDYQNQLVKLDIMIKSRFVEMFGDPVTNPMGWDELPLGELGELNRGISKHRPRNAPELLGGEYPLIQTGDVSASDLYIRHYSATYSEAGLKQSKMWPKGTLCITIAANIAKTAILAIDACFPDSVVGFLSGKKTNQIFIHFWFSFFQKLLEDQAPESAQKNINLTILNELKVIVPPLALQRRFASFVAQTDKSKFEIQQSLDKLELQYNALMQKYFG
jgi:type I restriction enzyme S subunit